MYHNTSKSFCKVKVRSGKGEINYGPADLPTPSDHLWPKNFVQGLYTPFNFFDIKYGVGPQGKEKCSSQCFLTEFWLFLWHLMFAQDHYTSVIQYHSDEFLWNKFGYRKKYVPRTSDVQTNRRTDKVTDRPIYLILGYFLWYHCRVTLCIVHTRIMCIHDKVCIRNISSTHEGFVLLHNGKKMCMYFSFLKFL